jgi:hypothetical protein
MDKNLAALEHCHNIFPGPNGIYNQMLTHLPPADKEFLLSLYSHTWIENLVPSTWREAVVVPVLKPSS